MPSSLVAIGERAFNYCTSLKKVTIPDNVTGIGNYAFAECSQLASAIVPSRFKGNSSVGTGNVFLNPLKESLRDTYASATIRYTVPKPADLGMKPKRKKKDEPVNPADEPRKTLALQPDELDPVMNEMAEHCRTTGLPMKFGLIDGHQLILGRVPEAQLKRMTPD
jgi:hypothetical protein